MAAQRGKTPSNVAIRPGSMQPLSVAQRCTGTPSFGYGNAATPGLDTQTPGTMDPYHQGMGAPTPGMGMTPALTESSGAAFTLPCRPGTRIFSRQWCREVFGR